MQTKRLKPDQIITLNDFPAYNKQILRIYFKIFKQGYGKLIPPCPVIHKSSVVPLITDKTPRGKKLKDLLSKYLEKNPKAEYFMIDGTHKTSAATLTHKQIKVIVLKNDKDIKYTQKLVQTGELFSFTGAALGTIKGIVKVLEKHFIKEMTFQTVEDKTRRMVREKVILKYMIDYYNKK